MSTNFKVNKYVSETDKLYKELLRVYKENGNSDAVVKIESLYGSVKSEDKLRLSFVGQYSAGKSTIIKALTNEKNILIDSDIATSEVKPYKYGNVLFYDTPGLNTNENKEHDELTAKAIRESDLLVYCITSDLFHEVTRNDFKALAGDYRSKLFLVINKMSKESGEYDSLVENYSKTINKTLAPEYSLSDFHHFFFDAKDYLDGREDNDEDCISDSHFEDFIKALNSFIEAKGLLGKMLTPLNIMRDSVDETLNGLEDDECVKEGRRLIQKTIKIIEEKKGNFLRESNREIQKLANKYIQKGDEISRCLGEKNYSFSDDDFQKFSEPVQNDMCRAVRDYFEKYTSEADEEFNKVMVSEQAVHFFKEYKQRLEADIRGKKNSAGEIVGKVEQGIGDVSAKLAPKAGNAINSLLARVANVSDGKKISLFTVNGSDLHNIVKDIGHKLGHKFKPFEALKTSKRIAEIGSKAGKWLGPILTGAGTLVELIGFIVEKNAEKKLEEAKAGVKVTFRGMSEEIEKYYNGQINEAAKEFDNISNALQEELVRKDREALSNKALRNELLGIKKRIIDARSEIEYGDSV